LLGETLKKSREEAGLDLHEVAHTLRIQYEYLKALESGNLERLPPAVYVRAYIREYARFLKIDAGPILEEYTSRSGEDEEKIDRLPLPEKRKSPLPRIALFAFLFIALISAFAVYFFAYHKVTVVPAIPVAPPARENGGEVPPLPESHHTLDVTAEETTWLRVEMAEGITEEVLMKPGETKKWTSPGGFNLRVGNAGGVRIVLNNRDIGVPGAKGRVMNLRLPEEGQ
jgi:cytoskeletal protein RodZ